MRCGRRLLTAAVVAAVFVAGCGSDGGSGEGDSPSEPTEQSDGDDFGEELADAIGAGGGGVLSFDGQEIPIASVTCMLAEDTFDVGTVSDNGFRVFVSRGNPLNDVSAQVLDQDSVQWFPQGVSGDEAQRDGGTFTSDATTYFNNSDDRTVVVSFTVECP